MAAPPTFNPFSLGVAGQTFTSSNQSGSAAAVTDEPTSGQKIVITDIELSVDTAMVVTFTEENTGLVVGVYHLPANWAGAIITVAKKRLSSANNRLMVQTSVSGNIAVTALYYSEP